MSLLTRDSGGGGRVACGKFGGGGCAVCVLSLVPVSGSCLCLWFLSLSLVPVSVSGSCLWLRGCPLVAPRGSCMGFWRVLGGLGGVRVVRA